MNLSWPGIFLHCFISYFWNKVPIDLGAHWLTRLAGQWGPGVHLSFCSGFLCGHWGSKLRYSGLCGQRSAHRAVSPAVALDFSFHFPPLLFVLVCPYVIVAPLLCHEDHLSFYNFSTCQVQSKHSSVSFWELMISNRTKKQWGENSLRDW